jgi:hypothetical protein
MRSRAASTRTLVVNPRGLFLVGSAGAELHREWFSRCGESKRRVHSLAIVVVPGVDQRSHTRAPLPINGQQLLRHVRRRDDVVIQLPLPIAKTGHALRGHQALLAAREVLQRGRRAEQVAYAIAEQRPWQRPGDEVGGPDLERPEDRFHIVARGQHEDRDVRTNRALPYGAAGVETVQTRHHDVEQEQVWRRGLEPPNAGLAVRGFVHDEALLLERPPCEQSNGAIIVDDSHACRSGCVGHGAAPASVASRTPVAASRSAHARAKARSTATTSSSAHSVRARRAFVSMRPPSATSACAPTHPLDDLSPCA